MWETAGDFEKQEKKNPEESEHHFLGVPPTALLFENCQAILGRC